MSKEELQKIAEVCIANDLIVITDEIYSELVYEDEYKHVSIASLPGMKERTILLHGFSKAYAMTGFRLGYSCAPNEITEAMMKIHCRIMFQSIFRSTLPLASFPSGSPP